MNKKRLSVVMAGAMLASSVAPVLAAESAKDESYKKYEVNGSNKGLLIRDLRNLLTSKVFKNVKENNSVSENLAGKSVYYAEMNNAIVQAKKIDGVTSGFKNLIDSMNKELHALGINSSLNAKVHITPDNKEHNLTFGNNVILTYKTGRKVGDKAEYKIVYKSLKCDNSNIDLMERAIQNAPTNTLVEVYDRGHIEKDGEFYGKYLEDTHIPATYTAKDLEAEYNYFKKGPANKFKAILDMELKNDVLTVYTRQVDNQEESGRKKFEYKVGDVRVNFEKPINDQKEELEPDTTIGTENWITHNIAGFAVHTLYGKTKHKGDDIDGKHLATVKITDVDNIHNVVLSELYDGLFLTTKGEELLSTMKEYDAEGYSVTEIATVNTNANGLYSIELTFEKTINKKTVKNVVRITSNDKEKMDLFAKGISVVKTINHGSRVIKVRKFPVQKLAGSNREETAVKVAKENADIRTVAENGNIVLVNRDSLVDGLAAAPLAASVINQNNTIGSGNYVAPILLTNTNGLSKVTKDYMKEVVAHQRVGALDKVTVYLVGGEAVISKAVENDLKEIGLRVVRAGGKDREATSLKVAELMKKDTSANAYTEAFLVGADGEADAMSIAGYAAENKTPIIVESRKGLSEDSIELFKGYKNAGFAKKDVTIIGGETVVSAATKAKLDAEGLKVERLSGAKRQDTNAEVINVLYGNHTVDQVVVSKDGKGNNGQLVDALTSASLAAKDHAPIVLGTKELTKAQINALELKAKTTGVYVYQVGEGVQPSVIRTIANRLGLATK